MSRSLYSSLLLLAAVVGCKEPAKAPDGPAAPTFEFNVPASYIKDIEASETQASALSKAIKSTIVRGVRGRDWGLVRSGLTADFVARLAKPEDAAAREQGGVDLRKLPAPTHVLDGEGFETQLASTVGQWASIDRASWKLFRSLTAEDEKLAYTEAHIAFAGVTADGRHVEWLANAAAELVGDGSDWKIRRLELRDATWSESRLEPFRDIGPVTGFRLHEGEESKLGMQDLVDLRQVTQTGGLSVLDFNRDGLWDLLATRRGRGVRVFQNDGAGGFEPQVLPAIANDSEAARFYLWLDLDRDGAEELVSTRVETKRPGHSAVVLYRWVKGRMRAERDLLRFEHPEWMREIAFEGIVTCDVNGDQNLDLLFVGYSHWDSLREKFNLVEGVDGMRNLLFINKGGLKFEEQGRARGLEATQYSFVAECADFDRDGDADIFVGNDYGKNNLYVNGGNGRFTEDVNHPFAAAHGFTMGLSMADYDNTGNYAVSLSNMYSHAGNRILPLVEGLSPDMEKVVKAFGAGNALYELQDGEWVDVAQERGVALAEWAWANNFFDIDNDGDKELYAINGFTTHSDPDAPDW